MSENNPLERTPIVRKPGKPVTDLPLYPGLPGKTGRTNVVIIPKRSRKPQGDDKPGNGADVPRTE
jgi:hypothetical protein